ncbi:uncharacterized protein LOC114543988 [Dendronephthya gigantea]|uniref:uncharacterized protein LOC114543988 n=1 Tax=Dendronephthya gigantea TaxID=151771 RepID=UPI0010697C31|nr:uncharacterized protein LOC114543988 [Dendronephthya gigantea]XP_028418554.1 uncharacterized protein LOC114543988 [Dendronephthya gigantea]
MDTSDRSREGHIQLQIEYGSQHGQVQVNVIEINSLILPAVKRLGISHVYVKSHLLNEKAKELLKTKSSIKGYFLPDSSKETKRKTEEVKLTLSCQDSSHGFEKVDETSRKNKIRKALQKQRERFRLRRNSDKVKTVVNTANDDDDGRATLSFERPLHYPSVSLYQLQTQCLHLTVCGRNVTTTRSYPIATTCIPLMIAIKQHQPTWYQLSYNPDLNNGKQESSTTVQETWDKNEGGTYTGRSLAWNRGETKDSGSENWLYKRKDYSRHLLPAKQRRQPATKSSLHTNISGQDKFLRPSRHGEFKQSDSGVGLDRLGRQESIEELYFDDATQQEQFGSRNLRPLQKQWKSEFVICGSTLDTKRTSNGANLDLSSLSLNGSLNRKPYGESIRGF